MRLNRLIILAMALCLAFPSIADGKDKKKKAPRGMVESMQSIPCGVKERGLTGLGSVFGSVGVQHVNSNEKLCPQYLLRTDELEYHIRPKDLKHATLLPIGHEAEFKIKKDVMMLKVPDSDKKMREYQVVSMEPVNSDSAVQNTSYRPAPKPAEPYTPDRSTRREATENVPPPH